MKQCGQCGGKMRRVHRTFLERFRYMAVYDCPQCHREFPIGRRYTYHFGNTCRCPECGTFRVVKLKAPDKIDPMHPGFLNWIERLAGGKLYHCCYCRVQFFDRRPLDPSASRTAAYPEAAAAPEVQPPEVQPEVRLTPPTDKASSGS